MALLTKEETIKDLTERLAEYTQFGMVFNYMLDNGDVDISDFEKMLFSSDPDKASISYSKILKTISSTGLDDAYSVYSSKYPNVDGLDTEGYNNYLNIQCLNNIINIISTNEKNNSIDRTYVNTYGYLLNDKQSNYARK